MKTEEKEVTWLDELFEDILQKGNLEIENLIWKQTLDT
jgi:hypothetical protein